MGVDVAPIGSAAFIALIVAVILIGAVVYARRSGHLQGRAVAIAVAAIVGLLIVFGMSAGIFKLL